MTATQRNDVTVSPGLVMAPVSEAVVVFDAVAQRAHTLGGLAAWVLTGPTPTTHDELVDQLCADTGATPEDARLALDAVLASLSNLGLIGRNDRPPTLSTPEATIAAPEPGWIVGATHAYLGHSLAFCGPDADLVEHVDAFLGPAGAGDAAPTVCFGVRRDAEARIRVDHDTYITFGSIDQMLWQLPGELNYFMSHTALMPVLHAGAVRTPDGRIIVVTGPIDAGKSTLIAALIKAGCDYASDESIGIHPATGHAWAYAKPLTMSAVTQRLVGLGPPDVAASPLEHRRAADIRADAVCLAGDIGPIDVIVDVAYRPEEPPVTERYDPVVAAQRLLANTLNPARMGQRGLEALCVLAETVPVVRLVHGDSLEAAAAVINIATQHRVNATDH